MREEMYMAMRLASVLVIAAVASAGCAVSHMETPRQLERGEVVIHGSVDIPGWYFFVPRGQGSVMYGLGGGDVTVHAGTAGAATNAGISGRHYLNDQWTFGVQNDLYLAWLEDEGAGGGFVPRPRGDVSKLSVTPRLIRSSEDGAYIGVQVPLLMAFFIRDRDRPVERWLTPGIVFGKESRSAHRSWRPQLELVLSVFPLERSDGDLTFVPWPQIHLGFNR